MKKVSVKITGFPQYAAWVNDYCRSSPDPFIKNSGRMIAHCFELDRSLPNRYGWRFSNKESLEKQIRGTKSPNKMNEIYWNDQLRNVEAYSITTIWRGVELIEPAIRSLNVREIIAPAVLARSLLELAAVFITNANTLEKNFGLIKFPPNTVVVSPDLEEMIVRMIWGTRLGNPAPYLKLTNVLTFIQRIAQNPNAKGVLPTYEYLCEVAHPNVIGNTRFWSHIDEIYPDGSERRVLSKYADQKGPQQTLDRILWSCRVGSCSS